MDANQEDKEFIAYKMYHNKSSKNVWLSAILGASLSLLLMLFGAYQWYKLNQWEQGGGVCRMQQSLWSLYKLGGKNLVSGLFIGIGILVLVKGYSKTRYLKKLAGTKDINSK